MAAINSPYGPRLLAARRRNSLINMANGIRYSLSWAMTSFDPDADAHLDHLAGRMIVEATSASSPNVFSATGFARENISIIHQQRRTTNLAWALSRTGRVRPGSVVGIVGASFSGLMLAIILAMVDDAIVYLFEKDADILPRFRDKAHRHLSPLLNSRALGKRFDPVASSAAYRSPVFAWSAGRASDVASAWRTNSPTSPTDCRSFSFQRS